MASSLKDSVLKYSRSVPRYTSYPTAPHFRSSFEGAEYARWLADIPAGKSLSFYVHVPFCPRMCWFCGCHTKITRRYTPVGDYVSLLKREIDLVGAALGNGRTIARLHFGGGSPSMLSPEDFESIVSALRGICRFEENAEIAIEIDPRQAGKDKITTYARAGVNRVSFGVQDFDETVLAAVNRPQPFHLTQQAVADCRAHGIENINMDFLYGLPFQTMDTMRRAMDYAIALNPARIALFGYAHVPWMKKHMRLIPEKALPEAAARYDLFSVAAETLQEAGYIPVGIDHVARPDDSLVCARNEGRLRRNFQGYTDDNAQTMIGLGVSAIGKLPQGYVQNTAHMPHYAERIGAGFLAAEKCCAPDAEDNLRGSVIERLMCYFAADIPALCREHGFPPDFLDADLRALSDMEYDGLIAIDAERTLTILDRHAARPTCAAFDARMRQAETAARHSSAV